jgi:predicted Zn-dependent protease with MMP-like domain
MFAIYQQDIYIAALWIYGESIPHVFPNLSDDERLFLVSLLLVFCFGLFWWWNRRAKKWLEENDRLEEFPNALEWLLGERQPKTGATLKYSEQEFQEMVSKALDEIPEEFDKEWKNVVVIVSTDWPTDADKKRMGIPEGRLVFGTYTGHHRAKGFRAESGSRHVIVIYQPALELAYASDKDRLQEEISRTVRHELAHHLGMTHEKMKEIGL